ncbi:MAG: HNH endonuclease signature motif containing protein [Clostridiaceae bacterium]|jgi:hypothetical protein|nr:HNH endonuclease signature motif containing protein [Clostridiaceae bacterium]
MDRNRTFLALMQRGLSSDVAAILVREGYTLKDLKQMSKEQLHILNLDDLSINKIYCEERPPIPAKTINKLLYDSRNTCCICRDKSKAIIIHHIEPWETSHSHDEENLVVLCLEHHGEAHTKHDLSINLTARRLKVAKRSWILKVQELDQEIARGITISEYACWDYFNVNRIFEILGSLNINLADDNKYYEVLLEKGYITKSGFLVSLGQDYHDNKSHWLDFYGGYIIASYLGIVMRKIILSTNIKVMNILWTRPQIIASVKIGDVIMIQGAFYFRNLTSISTGSGQTRFAYRQARGIRVEFQFDAWYCCSSSSRAIHLSGRKVATAFATVREISRDSKYLIIRCSVLAIGSNFNELLNGRFDNSFTSTDNYYFEDIDTMDNDDIV